MTDDDITLRKAHRDDINNIIAFIKPFVSDGILLPRTFTEMDELIDVFFVAEYQSEIVGCAALEIYSQKLAEIRSLAVSPKVQGKGVGKQLVQTCIKIARERDILEVMVVTSSEAFFRACGFDFTLPGEKKALFYQTLDQ